MTKRRHMGTIMLATAMLLTGCARSNGGPTSPDSASAPANDPTLLAAADAIQALGSDRFSDCYAGTVLDHAGGTITVYRTPECALDRAVRDRVSGITLQFRDARMPRSAMLELTKRIMTEADYWAIRGIKINGAGPRDDGSAVEVMTNEGSSDDSTELTRRYGLPVVAIKGEAIAPPAGPFRPTIGTHSPR